eukprot:3756444-Pleurochrysis_carterae.AAC.1
MASLATHITLRGACARPSPRRVEPTLSLPCLPLSLTVVKRPRGWWVGISICCTAACVIKPHSPVP